MKHIFILTFILLSPLCLAEELDVLSEKPLKQLFFRYAEGSLKNTEQEQWIKRWGRFDGVVVKAFNEEISGFNNKTNDTLAGFKKTYPNKLLLLHFNGRASLPTFSSQYASSHDYLYFLGTSAISELKDNEEKSTIKVRKTNAFSIRKNLKNNASEDVVIVELDNNGELNWSNTEHAKLISINKNGTVTLLRDTLNTGKIKLAANRAYIAQHVAKGPFSQETQRLWEYNWFKFEDNNRKLFSTLPDFLASNISKKYSFFDGLQFDVLTESHRTTNIGYPMKLDANSDGKPDKYSSNEYSEAHAAGIYTFLKNLRKILAKKKLILADGSYANQRATWLLNGIESEGWPSASDVELQQWSSGLNRHKFWQSFAQQPAISYIKVAKYHVPGKGSIEPEANIRRLVVAAGLLTNSAIVPAYKPNGLAFHKWPEFRKLKNIGKPLSELLVLTTSQLSPISYSPVKANQSDTTLFRQETLNNSAKKLAATHCIDTSSALEGATIQMTATASSSAKSESERPALFYIGTQNNQQKTFYGNKPFTAWFSWENKNNSPICFAFETGTGKPEISNLLLSTGVKIEARVFEKAVLFANNNSTPIKVNAKLLAPISEHIEIDKVLKGRDELVIPAKDIKTIRF
ncbi:hypothetical protein [Alteromonas naphthalenivorans]|uniref:Uncharacterized protein n=1 Tax=Alteromonas naphthalenivorans TaxID=715451 RepID=F5Z644_ALTNA|nr:hypothetical protein [Alteromonas naphthalenivorans]AEF05277.1 hypothetical protein ambt_18920 [Alteromonas naphthalenivorans]|tara:strand:+ start:4852 stop:6744 length:1893 start_codon:yes stop_codon:yes gene_type:complete